MLLNSIRPGTLKKFTAFSRKRFPCLGVWPLTRRLAEVIIIEDKFACSEKFEK